MALTCWVGTSRSLCTTESIWGGGTASEGFDGQNHGWLKDSWNSPEFRIKEDDCDVLYDT